MELLTQPLSGSLGDKLIDLLKSNNYKNLNMIVAFAQNSGVLRLKEAIEHFRSNGGSVNAYIGIDFEGTSYEALSSLLPLSDSLYVIHLENTQTFHPKIYDFLSDNIEVTIIGSHNLTGGGLWTNFESSVLIENKKPSSHSQDLQSQIEEYTAILASDKGLSMRINSQNDIDKLLQENYIDKEVLQEVKHTNQGVKHAKARSRHANLFKSGYPARIPYLSTKKQANASVATTTVPNTITASSIRPIDETIWMETRAMTGGSRNILDLSSRSLIERGNPQNTPYQSSKVGFMVGAVEFFGIDPTKKNANQDIVINFGGTDYAHNTILISRGKKANGTWRLQIKGISPNNVKITDALKQEGGTNYLTNKIVTFTRIKPNYFYMSIYPKTDLNKFKSASWILAHNGPTNRCRFIGILKKN